MDLASKYFAERLRILREKSGWTQGELAKQLKVSRGAISYYENGDRIPNIEFLDEVAQLFDVPVEYLLGYRENFEWTKGDNRELLFLTDQALNNLHSVSNRAEVLNSFLEHDYFVKFFDYFDDFLKTQNDYVEFDRSDMFIKNHEGKMITKDFMIFYLTQFFIEIVEDVAFECGYCDFLALTPEEQEGFMRKLEKKKKKHREQMKKMEDTMRVINDKSRLRNASNHSEIQRDILDVEGDTDGNDPEAR